MELETKIRERLPDILFAIALMVIFGYVYRDVFRWKMLSMGDLSPWHLSFHEAHEHFVSAWQQRGLGEVDSLLPGLFTEEVFFTLLFGGNSAVGQRFYYLSLLPLSAITMYIFLNSITSSRFWNIITSLAYSLNSITIGDFMDGGPPLLTFHAFFPLIILFFINSLEKKRGRMFNIFMFTLSSALLFSAYYISLLFIAPFIITLFLTEILERRELRHTIKIGLLFLCSLGILFILLLPMHINSLAILFRYYSTPVKFFGISGRTSLEILTNEVKDMYMRDSFTIKHMETFTFLLGVFSFLSLFIQSRRKLKRFLPFLLVAALTLLFWRGTAMGWTMRLFVAFPVLFAYKHSIKLVYMLIGAFAVMSAILIDEARERGFFNVLGKLLYKTRLPYHNRLGHVITSVVLCVIITIPGFTLLSFDMNPELENPYDAATMFFTGLGPWFSRHEVPANFYEIYKWLSDHREHDGFFRTLWLPSNTKFAISILPMYNSQTFSRPPNPNHTKLIIKPLLGGSYYGGETWTKNFGKLLAHLNVKYVIVNLNPPWSPVHEKIYEVTPKLKLSGIHEYQPLGDPRVYASLLDRQNDLKLVLNHTDFLIYENLDFLPHITAYSRIFLVAPLSTLNHTYIERAHARVLAQLNVTWLVSNPGFEDGLTSWMTMTENAEYLIDNTTYHSGERSLKIVTYEESYAAAGQIIDVSSDISYHLSGWAKTKNTRGKGAGVKIYFFDDEGNKLSSSIFWMEKSENWVRINGVVDSPPGAVEALLVLIGEGSKNGIEPAMTWFDGIIFGEDIPAPIDPPSQNWEYIGHPTDYPWEHGLMLAEIPNLLSQIPGLNRSYSLLIFEDLLRSNEATDHYLNISDAVIFLGDINSLDDGERWIYAPEVLMFAFEAESSLIPLMTPVAAFNHTTFFDVYNYTSNLVLNPSFENKFDSWTEVTEDAAYLIDNTTYHSGQHSMRIENTGEQYASIIQYISVKGNASYTLSGWTKTKNVDKSGLKLYFFDDEGNKLDSSLYWSEKRNDWVYINKTVLSPVGATVALIELIGQGSTDEVGTAITWFDDISFKERIFWKRETKIETKHIYPSWKILSEKTFSYGHALVCLKGGEANKEFFAPRSSYYRVILRVATDGVLSPRINDEVLNVTELNSTRYGLKWYESSPIYLERGYHRLSISCTGKETALDQVLMLSTRFKNITFNDVFSPRQLNITSMMVNPTEYSVQVESEGSVFIVLGESFNSEWNAYGSEDLTHLKHIPAFPLGWANGFYLSEARRGEQIKIVFARQETRNQVIVLWAVTWIFLIVATLYTYTRLLKSRIVGRYVITTLEDYN